MMRIITTASIGIALGLFSSGCGSDGSPVIPLQSNVTHVEGVIAQDSSGQLRVGGPEGVPLVIGNATSLTMNGRACSFADLQPGMTVSAGGSMGNAGHGTGHGSGHASGCGMGCGANGNAQSFHCSNVDVNSILVGAIESLDSLNASFTVAGITVVTDASTYIVKSRNGGIGAGCTAVDFGALRVGDYVNICGTLLEGGTILATRVCLLPAGTAPPPGTGGFTMQGVVSGLDRDAMTFNCGDYPVDYAEAELDEEFGVLDDGATVVVSGVLSDGTILATSVTVKGAVQGAERIVSGSVSGLDRGAKRFNLGGGGCCGTSGYTVDYSDAMVEVDLANNAKVCVQGTVTQSGSRSTIKAARVTKS